MKTVEQNSVGRMLESYAVPAIKVVEIRSNSVLAASAIEDYEENVIS